MDRAFADLFGVERAFRGIPMAGRMDPQILADAFDRAGLSITDGEEARFRGRYLACLREEIQQVHPDRRMMPAIRAVLDELAADEGVFLALLTGNYVEGARIKLEHFDLWRYFRSGAFGGDAPIRAGLVPVAMERARAFGWRAGAEPDVVVVGDTPHDVACAKANGVRAIGVATGPYTVEQLSEAGADEAFADLSGADARRALAGARG